MGELRHISMHRDDLLQALAAAPKDATVILVIDHPPQDITNISWHAPHKKVPLRTWSWLASIFQAFAASGMRKKS